MKTVLPLYTALPTPEEMRRWDEGALALFGIPPLLLMENAAQAARAALQERRPLAPESRILVFMGRGNNGGDGVALARLLHDEGHTVLVCAAGDVDALGGPAGEHADMAQKMGVSFLPIGSAEFPVLPLDWRSPDVVVDALTGTGIKGDLRDRELALVRTINTYRKHSFILALDIPSGLCGYTGKPRPEAVRAHLTVTFEAGKPGLYFPEAREYTGAVTVRRVGIPLALRTTILPSWQLLEPKKGAWAAPSPLQHKGNAGKALIIGGSEGMAGAPLLAALGSLRAGAGLVHAAVPAGLEPAFRAACPEVLAHPVGKEARWEENDAETLLALIRDIGPRALVLGPGMGRNAATREIVRAVLAEKDRPPVIVDADALFFFRLPDPAGRDESGPRAKSVREFEPLPLDLFTEKDVMTPHPGEMARMLPCSFFPGPDLPIEDEAAPAIDFDPDMAGKTPEKRSLHSCIEVLQEDRAGAMRAFTRVCRAVLVLKGPGTLIGRRGAPTVLTPIAAPALSVGGSGDVLAGICAGIIASGSYTLDAACLAVYLHARAGELLAEKAPRGHLARDIADVIPQVWKDLCQA